MRVAQCAASFVRLNSVKQKNNKMPMLTDLQGQIEKITYSDEESGFTIAKVKVDRQRDPVTVVGNLMYPVPGVILKVKVEWANHP